MVTIWNKCSWKFSIMTVNYVWVLSIMTPGRKPLNPEFTEPSDIKMPHSNTVGLFMECHIF